MCTSGSNFVGGSGRFLAADPGFLFAHCMDWSFLQSLGHRSFFKAGQTSDDGKLNLSLSKQHLSDHPCVESSDLQGRASHGVNECIDSLA